MLRLLLLLSDSNNQKELLKASKTPKAGPLQRCALSQVRMLLEPLHSSQLLHLSGDDFRVGYKMLETLPGSTVVMTGEKSGIGVGVGVGDIPWQHARV